MAAGEGERGSRPCESVALSSSVRGIASDVSDRCRRGILVARRCTRDSRATSSTGRAARVRIRASARTRLSWIFVTCACRCTNKCQHACKIDTEDQHGVERTHHNHHIPQTTPIRPKNPPSTPPTMGPTTTRAPPPWCVPAPPPASALVLLAVGSGMSTETGPKVDERTSVWRVSIPSGRVLVAVVVYSEGAGVIRVSMNDSDPDALFCSEGPGREENRVVVDVLAGGGGDGDVGDGQGEVENRVSVGETCVIS